MSWSDRMYIAGVIFGDGMLWHSDDKGYEVKITDKSETYIRYLAELIYENYGVRPKVMKDCCKNAWMLRAYKKYLYEAILEDLKIAKSNPDNHVIGGLYDAEGYWYASKKKLTFTNADKEIITLVHKFLTSNDIRHRIYERNRGQYTWYVVETYTLQAKRLLSILDLRHPKWMRITW